MEGGDESPLGRNALDRGHRAERLVALVDVVLEQIDVLNQLARGLANKEIADKLGISEYTTKDHLKSILAKLRVADRTQAVTAALQRGIIRRAP